MAPTQRLAQRRLTQAPLGLTPRKVCDIYVIRVPNRDQVLARR